MRKSSMLVLGTAALLMPMMAMAAGPSRQSQAEARSLAFFTNEASVFGLVNPAAELAVKRSRVDDKGVTHVRYQQLYRGVPVFEGEAISHVGAKGDVTVTSALRSGFDLDVTPKLGRDEAIAKALDLVGAVGKSQVLSADLQVLPPQRTGSEHLAWHVVVFVENKFDATSQTDLFIDAHDGGLAWSFDSLETSAAIGTGKTMYVGNKFLDTDFAGVTYSLTDDTRGGGNYTCDQNNRTGGGCRSMNSPTNVFGNNVKDSSDRNTAGADAHYGLMETWDYYLIMFGRNGIDGAGRKTYSRVHYGRNYQNAFWSNSCFCMTYGDGGSTFYPLVALDVAGHEMSHGVMSTEANLTYSGESGGLNESNSDIFGTMVEYSVNSTLDVPDYWIGERIYKANWSSGGTVYTQTKALRYMDDPHKDGTSPACWSSSLGSLDVHYSSGPNNHMFYLLAEGGTSKCNGNTVTGIGRDKAARIWYKAISDYMTSSTNYHGARTAALSAAAALYGSGSTEYNAVNAAFAAINVT
ncbi:MAG: M4 family metallopeptidase [Acidobacteria bacterium]|nr:M4 family metallopeptidase [Acidobacteriota bacterium]